MSQSSTLSPTVETRDSTPKDAPWRAVAAIGVGVFALVTSEFLPVGLLPQIARELGISEGQAGLMVTIPGLLAALAAPLTISVARAFDRRHVLSVLLALLVLSNLLVATSDGVVQLLLGRVLLGVAVGGFWTIGGSLGPRLRSGAQGARATSLIFSGVSLGTVAGVPAGTLLGELLGWRMVFAAAAVIALLVLGMLLAWVPSISAQASRGLRDIPQVLKLHKARVGLLAALLIFIGQFAAYTYISPFLLQHTGVSPLALSSLLLGYGAAGFIGNLLGGWGVGSHLRLTLIATFLLLALSMLLLPLAGSNVALAVALVMLWGLGFGLLPIAIQTWMFSSAPDRLESVSALMVSTAQAAIGAGALLGGLSVDHFGVASALWLGGGFALLTTVLVAALSRAPGRG